ncbi:MAG: hypothetical protein KY462_16300 [Actinobacteria bacterium]|nr:hypothetical protein [Actinomycetota bacterium]
MRTDEPGNGITQIGDTGASTRELLRRLTDLGMGEVAAAQLVLTSPDRVLARAIDAFELTADDAPVDARRWIAAAVEDPERIEDVLERRRGWDAWRRMHRSWEAADADRAEQERRSHGWGAAISEALDDRKFLRAVERVSEPIRVLGRRSLRVARAQLLAWAVAVHGAQPDVPLAVALAADLAGEGTTPDRLDGGLPEPPARVDGRDNLDERLAASIDQLAEVEHELPPEPTPAPVPSTARTPERTIERSLDRGW